MSYTDELKAELQAYKKVLKVAEQLLTNAALPAQLMHKFQLIKSLTIKKYLEGENNSFSKDHEAYNILGVVINSI